MNASEKLQRLSEGDMRIIQHLTPIAGRENHVFAEGDKIVALVNALPLIIEAIRAMEAEYERSTQPTRGRLYDPLAALERALP